MTAELIQRCAALGWTLFLGLRAPDGSIGWELEGNGKAAVFSSTESLVAWLEHQERHRPQPRMQLDTITTGDARERVEQAPMPLPGLIVEHQAELVL